MIRFAIALMGGVAGAALLPAMVAAQEAPAPGQSTAVPAADQDSTDIIVTATRSETNLQKTPVAITALSATTLRERGAQTLLDVAQFTPNLVVGGRGNQGVYQGSVVIRGMGSDAPDSAPSVGLYIDDVYYPSTFGNLLGLFDVQRVEVLRGPQGTLFGRNTIAGAIQYISNKPSTDKFGGYLEANGGTVRDGASTNYKLQGAVNVPVTPTLAVRAAVLVQQQGGYIHDQSSGEEHGRVRTKAGRAQLRWKPTDALTVDLKGETVKLTGNARAVNIGAFDPSIAGLYLTATNPAPPGPPPFGGLGPFAETRPFQPGYVKPDGSYQTAGFNGPDFFRLRYNAANAVIAYNLGDDFTIKSISGYSFSRSRSVSDFDDSPLAILESDRGTDRTKLFTQEVQLAGKLFDDHLRFTSGLYYYHSNLRTDPGDLSQIGFLPFPPNPVYKTKNVSKAAYVQATLDVVSGVSVTGGLRYSRENVDAIYPQGQYPENKRRFSDTSPYIGVNWQADSDVLLYAKASKGFRAGGFHIDANLQPNGNPNLQNGSLYFGPETAWTYEAGARLSLFDRRLRFNPTVFRTDWKDIQFLYIAFGNNQPIAGTQNAGDARLQGAELESQLQLTKEFQLTGAFSYLDAKYTKLSPTIDQSVVLTKSDPLAKAPEFKYSVGGRYSKALADGANITFSADYSWTDKQRSTVDGSQEITLPSFGLVNSSISFTPAGSKVTFSLYGTNLTNKYYLIGGINFRTNTGVLERQIGRPRELGASARINF